MQTGMAGDQLSTVAVTLFHMLPYLALVLLVLSLVAGFTGRTDMALQLIVGFGLMIAMVMMLNFLAPDLVSNDQPSPGDDNHSRHDVQDGAKSVPGFRHNQ